MNRWGDATVLGGYADILSCGSITLVTALLKHSDYDDIRGVKTNDDTIISGDSIKTGKETKEYSGNPQSNDENIMYENNTSYALPSDNPPTHPTQLIISNKNLEEKQQQSESELESVKGVRGQIDISNKK